MKKKNKKEEKPERKKNYRKRKEPKEDIGGRSIWTGSLSFGLVTIPVKLITALQSEKITFNMLHDKDLARLERKMINPITNKIVPPEDQVRGYEIEKDQYVIVTDEEIESVEPKRSKAIEILDFVDYGDVDPLYFDRIYYLVPSEIKKPYNLLTQAMQQNQKAAIAKFVLHSHEYLVMIRPLNNILSLFILHYQEEVVYNDKLIPDIKPDKEFVNEITGTIKEMEGKFNPDELVDEDQELLEKLIKNRASEAKEVQKTAKEKKIRSKKQTPDLISALEESLSKIKKK